MLSDMVCVACLPAPAVAMCSWLCLRHTDQQAIDVLQKAYGPGYKVVGVPGGTREVLLNAGEQQMPPE